MSDRDSTYWRKAYELLVEQTGRDLNDGYGIDPRKPRAPAATASPESRGDGVQEAISPAFTEGVESRAALIDGIWDEAVDLLVVTGLGHLVGTSGASALIEGFADAVLLYQKGGER